MRDFNYSNDPVLTFDVVNDTLGSAVRLIIHLLHEEEDGKQPNQVLIEKYQKMLRDITTERHTLWQHMESTEKMQTIDNKYLQLINELKTMEK